MHVWQTCTQPGCHRLLVDLEQLSEGLCDEHLLERDLEVFAEVWEQQTGTRLSVAELREAAEERREGK